MNLDNLQVLKGAKLTYIGRLAGTVELIFEKHGVEYVIHIGCFVRLFKNSSLFLTSDDVAYPREQPQSWENFNWNDMEDPFEKIGISLYDKKAEEIINNAQKQKLTVYDVIMDPIGNITILVNCNLIIQIIIDSKLNNENWYFFVSNKSEASPLVHDGYPHYLR